MHRNFTTEWLPLTLWSSLAAAAGIAGPQASSQDWPQFLGPNRNGAIEAAIPAGAKLVEAWRKPLGSGMAAIVVSQGRAFTLFTDDTDDFLVAMDAATGKDLWRTKIGKTHADAANGGPGSTPAVVGDLVVALGSSCGLQAVAARDGKVAWEVDLAAAYKTRFAGRGGCSISPLVHGSLVVLPTGATDGERLVALDAVTGKQVWSAKGVERSINTNPGYWETPSGAQLLYHYMKPPGTSGIAALNLKDGSTAWSLDAASGMSNTAPMPLPGGRVLLQMWSGSGVLEAVAGAAPRHVWSNTELTALPVPAIYADGYLYGFGGNSGEFFKCVDASTGDCEVEHAHLPGCGGDRRPDAGDPVGVIGTAAARRRGRRGLSGAGKTSGAEAGRIDADATGSRWRKDLRSESRRTGSGGDTVKKC